MEGERERQTAGLENVPESPERDRRSATIWKLAGSIGVALAVTAISYLWRLPRSYGPRAVLAAYLLAVLLVFGWAWLVNRRFVRRSYERHGRLTTLPLLALLLSWGVFFAVPCIYDPFDWAWTQPEARSTASVLSAAGRIGIGAGLAVLLAAFVRLGPSRSCGQEPRAVETSGLYRLTRNPQLAGGALLVAGYALLRPSWYALGWLLLFAALSHIMVLTEEEHLRRVGGQGYETYCRRVPRYISWPGRPRT